MLFLTGQMQLELCTWACIVCVHAGLHKMESGLVNLVSESGQPNWSRSLAFGRSDGHESTETCQANFGMVHSSLEQEKKQNFASAAQHWNSSAPVPLSIFPDLGASPEPGRAVSRTALKCRLVTVAWAKLAGSFLTNDFASRSWSKLLLTWGLLCWSARYLGPGSWYRDNKRGLVQ